MPTTANRSAETVLGGRLRFDIALNLVVVPATRGAQPTLPRDRRPPVFRRLIVCSDGDLKPTLGSEEVRVRVLHPAERLDAFWDLVGSDFCASEAVEDLRVRRRPGASVRLSARMRYSRTYFEVVRPLGFCREFSQKGSCFSSSYELGAC